MGLNIDEYLKKYANTPKRELILETAAGGDTIRIEQHAVNLVCSRDIKVNIGTSMGMAVSLASGTTVNHQTKKVLYINTFAGASLMKECMGLEIEKAQSVNKSARDMNAWKKNLLVQDIAYGEWDEKREKIMKQVEDGKFDFVIVNSFEYANMTPYKRRKMVMDLKWMFDQLATSVVVFSHDFRRTLKPYTYCRGAIGMLSSICSVVCLIGLAEEEEVYARKEAVRKAREEKARSRVATTQPNAPAVEGQVMHQAKVREVEREMAGNA